MKLTIKQNAVIHCLQKGCILITNNEHKGALVCGIKGQFHINNGLFWRLVNMGLIYQSIDWVKDRFNYILTDLGKSIKTKQFDITNLMPNI